MRALIPVHELESAVNFSLLLGLPLFLREEPPLQLLMRTGRLITANIGKTILRTLNKSQNAMYSKHVLLRERVTSD